MGTVFSFLPASRSRFFIISIITVSICLCYSIPGWTQSDIKVAGQVIDSNSGNPIPGAIVSILPVGEKWVSDQSGYFYFVNLPNGQYEIEASRIGYNNSKPLVIEIGSYSPQKITIPLDGKPIEMPSLQVNGRKTASIIVESAGNVTTIELNGEPLNDITNVISQLPELEIVESGQRKLLRLRGSQLNGIVVMLDGRVQNSLLSSEGDISTIPLGSISKIELIKGSNYQFGGLAGSINFITRETSQKINMSAEHGSYGYESYHTLLSQSILDGINFTFDTRSSYIKDNYQFIDPRDSIEIRNNNYSHDLYFLSGVEVVKNKSQLNIKGRYFNRQAGIPGPVFQATPDARSDIIENEIYADLNQELGWNLGLSILGGITFRRGDYDSPANSSSFIAYRTRFDENTRDIKFQIQRKQKNEIDLYFSLRQESLKGIDYVRPDAGFGEKVRLTNVIGVGIISELPMVWKIYKSAKLSLGIKRESGFSGTFWGPSATLRVNLDLPSSPGFDLSLYRSRRLPGLTDLFWKEDIFAGPNPDLLPEKSHGFEGGLDFHINKSGAHSFRISFFNTRYEDLIIWRKWGGDKFKPLNLSKADISGWEASVNVRPFSGPISVFYGASFIKPLNKENEATHLNKYLTFRPIDNQHAGFDIEIGQLKLSFSGHLIGKRYITEENTKALPPVDLYNFDLSYNFKISSIDIDATTEVRNIGNKQYEMLERQPERTREYRFGLGLSRLGNLL
jgi:vitamin B12 transporter